MSWKCRVGLHKWEHWEPCRINLHSSDWGDSHQVSGQRRLCEVCGYREMVEL